MRNLLNRNSPFDLSTKASSNKNLNKIRFSEYTPKTSKFYNIETSFNSNYNFSNAPNSRPNFNASNELNINVLSNNKKKLNSKRENN